MSNSIVSPTLSQENSSSDHRPALGEWCLIKGTVKRTKTYVTPQTQHESRKKIVDWETKPCEPFKAMFIGFRVIHSVLVGYGYDDDYYTPELSHRRSYYVWLFVKDGRTVPFYAFAKDVERLGGAQ